MPIGKNVQLGSKVRFFHPDLVDLHDSVRRPRSDARNASYAWSEGSSFSGIH
jgi:hypothetical protein